METKYRIYGIDDYATIIEDSLEKHALYQERFAIQMIMTEALTNAYRHGNQCDRTKSIDVQVCSDTSAFHKKVRIAISDCGHLLHDLSDGGPLDEEQLLMDHGRGLFLIRHYSDQVEVVNHALHIYKEIKEDEG